MPEYKKLKKPQTFSISQIKQAADLLCNAKNPCIYLGWGAVDASEMSIQLADILAAPVSTTLQGKSSFPANHPMYTGVGFGPASKPASQNAFKDHDAMLAVGCRFSELGTGSYGIDEPNNLIHIDINPEVFDKNYKSKIAIEGDATEILSELLKEIKSRTFVTQRDKESIADKIKSENDAYFKTWTKELKTDLVSPGHFFKALREKVDHNAMMVVDDGTHTFLAAELFPVYQPRHFISPTDFNCMGYCVPAAIGTKLANPTKQVVAIVGDGAFLMTCMELVTASSNGIAPIYFIFHDGELGQISQFQEIPLNRKTCTIIGDYKVEGIAIATGSHYIAMHNDYDIDKAIDEAIKVAAEGKPVLVDINIDYSKKTMLTKGVVVTNLKRFPLKEKVRFIARAAKRHLLG